MQTGKKCMLEYYKYRIFTRLFIGSWTGTGVGDFFVKQVFLLCRSPDSSSYITF